MTDLINAIMAWFNARHWRTWLAHSILAFTWMLPLNLPYILFSVADIRYETAFMLFGYYLLREIEQVLLWGTGTVPWYDHILDVVAPSIVAFSFLLLR